MKAEKVGIFIEEVLTDGSPYKVWAADRLACRTCGSVCFKTAARPTAEHFEESYAGWAAECVLKVGEGKP